MKIGPQTNFCVITNLKRYFFPCMVDILVHCVASQSIYYCCTWVKSDIVEKASLLRWSKIIKYLQRPRGKNSNLRPTIRKSLALTIEHRFSWSRVPDAWREELKRSALFSFNPPTPSFCPFASVSSPLFSSHRNRNSDLFCVFPKKVREACIKGHVPHKYDNPKINLLKTGQDKWLWPIKHTLPKHNCKQK